MGRFFHNLNTLRSFHGTIASTLRRALSSYYPFQTNNLFKKGKSSKGLERGKGSGRSFSHRPVSSETVPTNKEGNMKTGEAIEGIFKPKHQLILINNKPLIRQLIPTKGRRFIVGSKDVTIPDSFYEGLKHFPIATRE